MPCNASEGRRRGEPPPGTDSLQTVGERTDLQTLAEYPPVQGGNSFDLSNIVEEFINKAQQ
jgi:hypothetical protein